MTVCVAAIARNGIIFGAADRVITDANRAEYEPRKSKILHFNDRPLSIMYAGDLCLVAEVTADVSVDVAAAPTHFLRVADVARQYAKRCSDALTHKADALLVRTRGFSLDDLNRKRAPVSAVERRALLREVAEFAMPDPVCALIVGIDPDGTSHIWRIWDRHADSFDDAGYCAIGIGSEESERYFRESGYVRRRASSPEAMYAVYAAKRQGERMAGVGTASNMFVRVPEYPLERVVLTAPGLKMLDQLYRRERATISRVHRAAVAAVEKHMRAGAKRSDAARRAERVALDKLTRRLPPMRPPKVRQLPPESTHGP